MGYDDGNDFYSETMRRARKEHRCCECRRTIRRGEMYEHVAGKTSGYDRPWTSKTCAECREIRKALVCGSWMFGALWEHIDPYVYESWDRTGPWDCLAKVESEKARQLLMDGYDEWREERAS
jgi:hypothetical protein